MSEQHSAPAFLNYVTDESFRRSLVSDHREMTAAVGTESWKAVHVLAGSLVEAILVDCLHGRTTDPKKRDEILKYDLSEVVKECKAAGVLNAETEALCVVVRNYRNLIHPGRVKRLDQEITRERAQVAVNLVTMVAEAVAKVQKDTYGYTGEQILAKITNDSKAFPAVLPNLAAKVHDRERERLLFKLLPDENFLLRQFETTTEEESPSAWGQIRCIRLCYTYLLERVDATAREKAVKYYVNILLNGTEPERRHFEAGFLHSTLGLAARDEDKTVIKNHVFEMLKRGASQVILDNTAWLGKWVTKDDFGRLTDAFLGPHETVKAKRDEWISYLYSFMDEGLYKEFEQYLVVIAEGSEDERYGSVHYARRIRELLAVEYIPF